MMFFFSILDVWMYVGAGENGKFRARWRRREGAGVEWGDVQCDLVVLH
jgi:hypothetical protein